MDSALTKSLSEIIEFNYLLPEKSEFIKNELGFIDLTYDGKAYKKVSLIRLLPLSEEDGYISCFCADEEVGIIKTIAEFSQQNRNVINHALEYRYFCPTIEKIASIKEKMSMLFIDCVVGGKNRILCINNLYFNVRLYKEKHLALTDADNDCYLIENYKNLHKNILQKIEVYI